MNIALNKHESCCIGSCFLTAGLRAIATMVAPASKSLFIFNFFRMCGLVDWQQNKQSKTFLYVPSIIYYADSLSFRPIPSDFFPLTQILSIVNKSMPGNVNKGYFWAISLTPMLKVLGWVIVFCHVFWPGVKLKLSYLFWVFDSSLLIYI